MRKKENKQPWAGEPIRFTPKFSGSLMGSDRARTAQPRSPTWWRNCWVFIRPPPSHLAPPRKLKWTPRELKPGTYYLDTLFKRGAEQYLSSSPVLQAKPDSKYSRNRLLTQSWTIDLDYKLKSGLIPISPHLLFLWVTL